MSNPIAINKNNQQNKTIFEQITPLIITYNEAPNIGRSIEKLSWADKIIVIDSYSNDATLEILESYSNVQVFQREYDTHGNKWNYGLQQVKSKWTLALDADFILRDEFVEEIRNIPDDTPIDCYSVTFKYCALGKPLRSSIMTPRQVLFRTDKVSYIDDGHTQVLRVNGNSGMLSSYIYHDDRKPLSRWFLAESRYSKLEAEKLLKTPLSQLNFPDRIRRQKVIAPILVPLYCLFFKGGIFDGSPGVYYAFQRTISELFLAIHIIEGEWLAKETLAAKNFNQVSNK